MIDDREFADRSREINETHAGNEYTENFKDKTEQGPITTSPEKEMYEKYPANSYGVVAVNRATGKQLQNTGTKQRRYPYGAVPAYPESQTTVGRYDSSHMRGEIRNAQSNPVSNSFELNRDRVFPKDTPPKGRLDSGARPLAEEKERRRKGRLKQDAERDEVNAFGNRVWAGNDPLQNTKAVFYEGTNQMEELGKG